MPDTVAALEHRRSALLEEFCKLGDLRSGSVTGTGGRCGNRNCHCHQEGDPGHGPHPRLTYKSQGKTITESFPTPLAQRKAEREIAEFRRYQELSRAFVEVNDKICRQRPVEESLTEEEKKRPRRSSRRPPKK